MQKRRFNCVAMGMYLKHACRLFSLGLLLATSAAYAQNTQLTWFGHSAFRVVTPKGVTLWIDPWLNGKVPLKDVKADYILITHGHFDHVGDAVAIAKSTKAKLVANFELGTNMVRALNFPADQVGFETLGNTGGRLQLAQGEVTVLFTPARHSSSLDIPNQKAPLVYAGNPNGFVIHIKDGPTLYHTGDTAYFSDMKELSAEGIDVALVNVGGHFAMDAVSAVKAVKQVKARYALPHHYGTFPILAQNADAFVSALKGSSVKPLGVQVAEPLEFQGKKLRSTPSRKKDK